MPTPETANPGNESAQGGRAAGACVMVLFGAAGDLTKAQTDACPIQPGKSQAASP